MLLSPHSPPKQRLGLQMPALPAVTCQNTAPRLRTIGFQMYIQMQTIWPHLRTPRKAARNHLLFAEATF